MTVSESESSLDLMVWGLGILLKCTYLNNFLKENRHIIFTFDPGAPQCMICEKEKTAFLDLNLKLRKNDTETGTYNMLCSTHRDL